MAHVLVTTDYLQPGDTVHAMLTEAGHTVTYAPAIGPRHDDERRTLLRGVDAVVLASEPVTASMLDTATDLAVIARSGVGYDSVDVEAATERGIWVCNTPGVNHHAVAEMTLALMLTTARHLNTVLPGVQSGDWPRTAGTELRGRTLGIVGFGASGRAVASLALAFGMTVLVTTSHPDDGVPGIDFVDLFALQERADYVTLHCQATPHNRHLVDMDFLRCLKSSAVVVNTARGSLIDEAALARALDDGQIAAAALDVLESEPPGANSPLTGRDDVVIVSHLAGQTEEARRRAGEAAARQVLAVLNGQRPSSPVNTPVSLASE